MWVNNYKASFARVFFYFDESGDSGHPKLVNTPTKFFVLSCVAVHQDAWGESLDKPVALRSRMRRDYGLRMRGEIKATDFHRGRGAFFGLGMNEPARMNLYRQIMQYEGTELSHLTVFSIAINKSILNDTKSDIRTIAWQYALQRVDRFLKPSKDGRKPGDLGLVFPDHGHGDMIRKLMRRIRRFQKVKGHFGGQLDIPTERIVEDPSDRDSQNSYFVQLADWNALASHRSKYIDPNGTIPDDLWDELGEMRLKHVNRITTGPPGIVLWPRA